MEGMYVALFWFVAIVVVGLNLVGLYAAIKAQSLANTVTMLRRDLKRVRDHLQRLESRVAAAQIVEAARPEQGESKVEPKPTPRRAPDRPVTPPSAGAVPVVSVMPDSRYASNASSIMSSSRTDNSASMIRMRPLALRRRPYGSCEPVGLKPARKQPQMVSMRSATPIQAAYRPSPYFLL